MNANEVAREGLSQAAVRAWGGMSAVCAMWMGAAFHWGGRVWSWDGWVGSVEVGLG